MPYGMKGGDTPAKDKWMEKCVADIHGMNSRTHEPYTKGDKIAICKAQYEKSHGGSSAIDPEVFVVVAAAMNQYASKLLKSGRASTQSEAEAMTQSALAKANYDYTLLEFILNR